MKRLLMAGVCGVCFMLGFSGLHAQSSEERLKALEQKVAILSEELERTTFNDVYVPVGEKYSGLGPAASKIYVKEQGLSIGGYGEMIYQHFEDDSKTDNADFLRAILYVGYKWNDRWVLNTEFEFEHASTDKEGSASVEFATIDFLWQEAVNLRAGLVLLPVGLVNELHEPNIFHGVSRPLIENRIIPTTWRENGLGAYGDLGDFSYRIYLVNGMDAEGFSAKGLRGGRQKGSKAKAEDLAITVRLDYEGISGLLIGGSVYHGNSGQGMVGTDSSLDVSTTLIEGHMDYRYQGFGFRALISEATLDDVAALNRALNPGMTDAMIDSIGETMDGFYVQGAYDFFHALDYEEQSLTGFVRYSEVNTQVEVPSGFTVSGAYDLEIVTAGVSYQPFVSVVIKGDHQVIEDANGFDEKSWNLGMGYVF